MPFLDWLNVKKKIDNLQERREIRRLRSDYAESAELAADLAQERIAIKEGYGTIVAQAAGFAQERAEIRLETQAVGEEAAAVFAGRTSLKQTTFHLLKGNIGPGCLSLPWSFSQLGIPTAAVATVLIAYWTYHNCVNLVHLKRKYSSNRRTITYSDLGELAFGKGFRVVVTASIVMLQMAVCTVFLSFVADNTQAFFGEYLRERVPVLATNNIVNVLLAVPIAAGLTLIPNLKALGPVSEVSTELIFLAFGILGIILGLNYEARPDSLPKFDWIKAPLAFCGILYAFEGICIVLPLESTMKRRDKFLSIFSWSYVVIAVVYTTIGSVCVWILGSVENGSITAFLLENVDKYNGDLLVTVANLLVSAAVLGTYALTIFPCIELWCQSLERGARGDDSMEPSIDEDDWWGGSLAYGPFDTPLLRLGLVAGTLFAAIAIPNVRQLIGLAGAVAGASTALILPPLLILKLERDFDTATSWSRFSNTALLMIGILFGLIGSSAAVYDIIQTFTS
jgi:proton-coupled amino acid transporter